MKCGKRGLSRTDSRIAHMRIHTADIPNALMTAETAFTADPLVEYLENTPVRLLQMCSEAYNDTRCHGLRLSIGYALGCCSQVDSKNLVFHDQCSAADGGRIYKSHNHHLWGRRYLTVVSPTSFATARQ